MVNNHMKKVAQMLGVELKEVFRIDGNGHYFRLTDTGLEVSVDMDLAELKPTAWFSEDSCMLSGLLTCELKINKLPWKPRHGDKYWMPTVTHVEVSALWSKWSNSDNDRYRYKHGLICRTKEEAIELTEKLLAMAKEEKSNG